MAAPSSEVLPESASLLLDLLRFGLALLVVIGHTSLPQFSKAWPPLLGWADLAVPGFFVLSGFMIRFVTTEREQDPVRYFISRASRMYSVLLPAIVFTLACRVLVLWKAPQYASLLISRESVVSTLGHTAAHVVFFTQFWGHAVLLDPNLPLWSLGYEVPYYILFGLAVLCRGGWRWFALVAYAIALGPQVLFLLPLWWSGCILFDVWQWSRRDGVRRVATFLTALCLSALLLIPTRHMPVWEQLAQATNPLVWLRQPPVRATMPAYAAGMVAWALMLLGLCLSDTLHLSPKARWAKPVRRVAEGTFTLYLFHYPMLCLFVALHGRALESSGATVGLLLLIVAISVAISSPIDAWKNDLRRLLARRFAVRARPVEPRAL